jgi:hypothetical protein
MLSSDRHQCTSGRYSHIVQEKGPAQRLRVEVCSQLGSAWQQQPRAESEERRQVAAAVN